MFELTFEGIKAWLGQSHIIQNITVVIILLLLTFGAVSLWRNPFWRPRLVNTFRKKMKLVALVIAFIFFTIAALDSISWRSAGETLNETSPRSILDRVFAACTGVPEWEFVEEGYSAPMAETTFGPKKSKLKYFHLMGTDKPGADTFLLVLKGCRPAVAIGILPLIVLIPLAMTLGIMAGFFGGRFDDFVVYIYTTLSSIPGLLLLIAIITALGQGVVQVAFALGVTGWVGLCRLVRAETFKIRELEYVQAAKCLGVSKLTILRKHVVPNLIHIVIISSILAFTTLVLSESILSYLGIGLESSWGGIIDKARSEVAQDPVIWWNIIFASSALFLLVLAVNVVGDALRDALDPRTSSE